MAKERERSATAGEKPREAQRNGLLPASPTLIARLSQHSFPSSPPHCTVHSLLLSSHIRATIDSKRARINREKGRKRQLEGRERKKAKEGLTGRNGQQCQQRQQGASRSHNPHCHIAESERSGARSHRKTRCGTKRYAMRNRNSGGEESGRVDTWLLFPALSSVFSFFKSSDFLVLVSLILGLAASLFLIPFYLRALCVPLSFLFLLS